MFPETTSGIHLHRYHCQPLNRSNGRNRVSRLSFIPPSFIQFGFSFRSINYPYGILPFLTRAREHLYTRLGYHRALWLLSPWLMYTGCRTALTTAARKREKWTVLMGLFDLHRGLKMREKTGIVRVSIQVIHFVEGYWEFRMSSRCLLEREAY